MKSKLTTSKAFPGNFDMATLSSEDLSCPECGGALSLSSSSSMQTSILSCDDCSDFRMQRNCDEDTLLEKFIGKHPECVQAHGLEVKS